MVKPQNPVLDIRDKNWIKLFLYASLPCEPNEFSLVQHQGIWREGKEICPF